MATIYKVDPNFLSPNTAALLTSRSKKIVDLNTSSPAPTDSVKKTKTRLTTTAPQLVPTPSEQDKTLLQKLAAYMASIVLLQITLSNNEGKISDNMTTVSQDMVTYAQKQATDAEKQYQNYLDEQAKAHSFWGEVLHIVMDVVGGVLAVFSGGTLGAVIFTALVLFSELGGMDKLTDALKKAGLSDAEIGAVEVGVVIAASMAGAAVGGLLDAGVDTFLTTGKAALQESVEESTESAASKSDSFLSKAGSRASAEFGNTLAFTTMTINPFNELMIGLMNATHASDETKSIVEGVVGMVLAVAAALAIGRLASSSQLTEDSSQMMKSLREKLNGKFGPNAYRYLYNAIDGTRMAASLGYGGFSIYLGKTLLDEGDTLKQLGVDKYNAMLGDSMMNIVNQMMQSEGRVISSLNNVFREMTSNWNDFVRPSAEAAQILG